MVELQKNCNFNKGRSKTKIINRNGKRVNSRKKAALIREQEQKAKKRQLIKMQKRSYAMQYKNMQQIILKKLRYL